MSVPVVKSLLFAEVFLFYILAKKEGFVGRCSKIALERTNFDGFPLDFLEKEGLMNSWRNHFQ